MSHPLTFWIPKPPDNANVTAAHPMVAAKVKRRYVAELVKRQAIRHGFPPPPAAPFQRAELHIYWHYPDGRHHLDDDNAIRRLKPARDFLVAAGYLADDRDVRITGVDKVVGAPTPPLCTVQLVLTPTP